MSDPLLYPLVPEGPWLASYALVNGVAAAVCLGIAAYLLIKNPNHALRPAYMMAAALMLFYQLPLAVFSPILSDRLPNAIWYGCAVNITVLVLLAWVRISHRWTLPSLYETLSLPKPVLAVGLLFTISVVAGLLGIYFMGIPWSCSALHALLTNRDLVLLVREVVGKLSSSPLSSYALGMIVNAASPAAAFLCFWCACRTIATRRWYWTPVFLSLFLLALVPTLVGGAKGNMVPALITVAVAGCLIMRTWRWRMAVPVAIMGLLLGLLVFMDAIANRQIKQDSEAAVAQTLAAGSYDFGRCIVRLQACEQTPALFASLRLRTESLGLTTPQINVLDRQMTFACRHTPAEYESMKEDLRTTLKEKPEALKHMAMAPLPLVHAPTPIPTPSPPLMPKKVEAAAQTPDTPNRAAVLAKSILQRAFVVPFQVSVWHFKYVAEYGAPGKLAAPMAKRIYGDSLDITQDVYQKYGSVYSGGDRTSTSTAPTSFFITYPAYFGVVGLIGSLLCAIVFDCILSWIIRRSNTPYQYLGIGLVAAACLNFMVSDFFTVMLSHGAMAATMLLVFFIVVEWLYRHWRATR